MYKSSSIENVLVLDVGTANTRVGYAGEEFPRQILPSYVGIESQGLAEYEEQTKDTLNNQGAVCGFPPTLTHWCPKPTNVVPEFPICANIMRTNLEVRPCLEYDAHTGQYNIHANSYQALVQMACEGGIIHDNNASVMNDNYDNVMHQGAHTHNTHNNTHKVRRPRMKIRNGPYIAGLRENATEVPMILSDQNVNCERMRYQIAELLFETFQTPSMYLCRKAVLNSISMGKFTSLIIECGHCCTSVTPISDCSVVPKAHMEWAVAGDALNKYIAHLFRIRETPYMPHYALEKSFEKVKGATTAKTAKTNLDTHTSHVHSADKKYDTKNRIYRAVDCSGVCESYWNFSRNSVVAALKESVCVVAENEKDALLTSLAPSNLTTNGIFKPSVKLANKKFFELPDGNKVDVAPFTYRVPEMLFSPQLFHQDQVCSRIVSNYRGLSTVVGDCINAIPLEGRRDILSNIIVAGGTSLLPGFIERLNLDIHNDKHVLAGCGIGVQNGFHEASALPSTIKMRIVSSPSAVNERNNATFVGASILASLGSFSDSWITRNEYLEHGASIVDRKCG